MRTCSGRSRRTVHQPSHRISRHAAQRLRNISAAAVLAFALSLSFPGTARAQTSLDDLRSEMQASSQRLSQLNVMMFRMTMQDPRVESRVSLLTSLTQSVQIDFDYLEALLQMVPLARDREEAVPVVLTELAGARDRMQFEDFERSIQERGEARDGMSRALASMEDRLLSEMREVRKIYTDMYDWLTEAAR